MDKKAVVMVCDLGIDELAKKIAERILEIDGLKLYDFGLTEKDGLYKIFLKDRKYDPVVPTYDKAIRLIQPDDHDSFLARTHQCIDCVVDTGAGVAEIQNADRYDRYARYNISFVLFSHMEGYDFIDPVSKRKGTACIADNNVAAGTKIEDAIRAVKYLLNRHPSPGRHSMDEVKEAGF